ncbi:hypothetical protein AB0C70_10530 [Streptomyces sp. NPDC048564]|uniref:hypothetical protein n=1 Tax=Streptomyces sp. NPDC048564 TaxID=3155760 RepID=UPI003449344B
MVIDGLPEGRAGSGTYVRVPRERLRLVRSRRGEYTGSGSPSIVGVKERGKAAAWDAHSQVRVPAPEGIAERLAMRRGSQRLTDT